MKTIMIAFLALLLPVIALAGSGNRLGVAYLSVADGTKIYTDSTGEATDLIAPKNFPLLAWVGGGTAFFNTSSILSSESISDGRLHVRYFTNGKNDEEGQNTAWVNPGDVQKINFDCCGGERCSGLQSRGFGTFSFSECFSQSVQASLDKMAQAKPQRDEASSVEIEKLKLQLEIEKLKLETERLKTSAKP